MKKYGDYEVIDDDFAKGGNASVKLVKDSDGKELVLKLIKINGKEDYKKVRRFLREITVVESNQDQVQGIIPIVKKSDDKILNLIKESDEYKTEFKGIELWYVMNKAIPINTIFKDKVEIEKIIDCILSLAETLSILHSRHIVHRDIKPSNLYQYNGQWAFGDFGLVTYPEADDLTRTSERVGNFATIAPEMRRAGEVKDARPADVWSMAKTLWMLLTQNTDLCFEGSYNSEDKSISLKEIILTVPVQPLEEIIQNATKYNVKERLTIDQFAEKLKEYREVLKHRKKILSQNEYSEKAKLPYSGDSFHYTCDRSFSTEKVIRKFYMDFDPEDSKFIAQGYTTQVNVLRYIKMKLEKYMNKKYLVSPIVGFFRNTAIPCIEVLVEYIEGEAKLVTYVLCDENELLDFIRFRLIEYQKLLLDDGSIDTVLIDKFIELIDESALEAYGLTHDV